MKSEKKERRSSLPLKQPESTETFEKSGEEKRLGSKPPLLTILSLVVGPFISQSVQAFYGVVNLFWVSRGIGDEGIRVFGAIFIIDYITTAFSDYLMTSINIQLSYLFGQSNYTECAQLFIDFTRISFFLAILMPPILLTITKPFVSWFGAGPEISEMCFQYVIPTACGSFFTFLFMCLCGLLQSEGHSTIFGVAQTSTLLLDMFVLCPLFLLGFKFGIWGASLATVCSQMIVSIVLLFMVGCGKFTVKPKFGMLFKKFSKETWKAMKVGIASLLTYLSIALPDILIQKFILTAAIHIDEYNIIIQVWGVIEKLFQFVGGANSAIIMSFLPSASFAFGANRHNRILRLFFHSVWILFLLNTTYSLIMILFPGQICAIWSKNQKFLEKGKQMVPIVFYFTFLYPFEYIIPSLLQATQKVLLSTILAFITQLVPFPLFSCILYFTNKNDPVRLMWTYALGDVFSALTCAIFATPLLIRLCKEPRDELICNNNNNKALCSVRSIKSENCSSTPLLIDDN